MTLVELPKAFKPGLGLLRAVDDSNSNQPIALQQQILLLHHYRVQQAVDAAEHKDTSKMPLAHEVQLPRCFFERLGGRQFEATMRLMMLVELPRAFKPGLGLLHAVKNSNSNQPITALGTTWDVACRVVMEGGVPGRAAHTKIPLWVDVLGQYFDKLVYIKANNGYNAHCSKTIK